MHIGNHVSDPRRPDREHRYKQPVSNAQNPTGDDLTPDYMNILGMIFSMCGLMMRVFKKLGLESWNWVEKVADTLQQYYVPR